VLESFEEDAPVTADPDVWSPPFALDPVDATLSNADLADQLERDIATLIPLHEEAARADGWGTFCPVIPMPRHA